MPSEGGERTIVLGPGCTEGTGLHEIFHALGRGHEQIRYDRDTYVTIHEENFDSGRSILCFILLHIQTWS